jgi:hypothetical protein
MRIAVIVVTLALTACSGSTPTLSSSTATLTGSAADAVGDTVILPVLRNGVSVTPVVPTPPDLVSVTVTVSNGNLTATIGFAPGTFSHADSFACLLLDVDENAGTGNPPPAGDPPIGYDYSICAVNPRGSTRAQLSQLSSGAATGIGSVDVMFPSSDSLRFTVPMSMLGNDEGRMAFKVVSMQWVDAPVFNTAAIDWMPDLARPATLVR